MCQGKYNSDLMLHKTGVMKEHAILNKVGCERYIRLLLVRFMVVKLILIKERKTIMFFKIKYRFVNTKHN